MVPFSSGYNQNSKSITHLRVQSYSKVLCIVIAKSLMLTLIALNVAMHA